MERFGQSTLAVAVGRVDVRARPEVPHLAALDPWLDRARRRNPPATVSTGVRRVDAAMFALATRGGSLRLQEVLAECAAAELAVGRATAFRSAPPSITPISELPASDWVPLLDDGSAEFRVACALASQHDDDGACLRWMLRAVGPSNVRGRLEWSERPPAAPGLGVRPLCRVLGDALARRAVEVATRAGDPPRGGSAREEGAPPGATMAFEHRLAAPAADVVALVAGELDEDRVGRLLGGLMLLEWRRSPDVSHWFTAARHEPPRAGPAWGVLAPFFHGRPIALRGESVHLRPEAGWASQLAAGRVEPVVRAAIRRLQMARLDPAIREEDAPVMARAGPPGHRLAAALLCPIPGSAVAKLLRRVVPPPLESEKEDTR